MSKRRIVPRFEISVLMLAKDKAKYLGLASHSVIEAKDVELVLVEPGSNDDSRKICEKLKQDHLQQVSLVTKSDLSAAEGLNNGLAAARGSIIGVLNGDDVYLPGALRHVSDYFACNPHVDVLLGCGFLVNQNSGKWKFVMPSKISRRVLGLSQYGSLTFFHQGMFFRSSKFPDLKFNPNNQINWDKEFLIELWNRGARFGYCDIPVAIFRLNEDSISSRGFSKSAIDANTAQLSDLLQFKSSDLLASLFGYSYRITKALSLARHTLKVHMSSFQMSASHVEDK